MRGGSPKGVQVDWVLVGLATALFALVANVGLAARATGRLSDSMTRLRVDEVALFDAAWQVRYLDEALTHSATQFVLTEGEIIWKERYHGHVDQLDQVLGDLQARAHPASLRYLEDVSAANNELVRLEDEIFAATTRDDTVLAESLLMGRYLEQKKLYQTGLDKFFSAQRMRIDSALESVRRDSVWLRNASVGAGIVLSTALLLLGTMYRRQRRQLGAREQERSQEFERQAFEQRLARALELAQSEEQALATMRAALQEELPAARHELLLADSSVAHLRQMVATHPTEVGCGVTGPRDCPAIRNANTMTFSDPERYDACPHLHQRSLKGCSVRCTPVSVMGATTGVLHTVEVIDEVPLSESTPTQSTTDLIAARVGERLGVLRAFATSELQATTDPLTGLLNRRSLEHRAGQLRANGSPTTAVFFDLDHFKSINDTHGHEIGDAALRRFARILRDCSRSSDLIGRWGGEEFVMVVNEDRPVADALFRRISEELVLTGATGELPGFTVSAGAAQGTPGETFGDTLRRADEALLSAKASGRNQLIHAVDPRTFFQRQYEQDESTAALL
jgi:diguanylate cyclase (GGDEF)-like protein